MLLLMYYKNDYWRNNLSIDGDLLTMKFPEEITISSTTKGKPLIGWKGYSYIGLTMQMKNASAGGALKQRVKGSFQQGVTLWKPKLENQGRMLPTQKKLRRLGSC